MNIDYMFIGIHPDDIEIGIGGLIGKLSDSKKIILVDLTMGEMGSNGNPEIRFNESQNAKEKLGAHERICLNMEDANIYVNKDYKLKIIDVIRKYRPTYIFFPYERDYHPDHENGSRLIKESIFASGLSKVETQFECYRPSKYFCYYINDIENPTFFIDVSSNYYKKIDALSEHKSQFFSFDGSKETYLNSGFIEKIVRRDSYFGDKVGCKYAEPIYYEKHVLIDGVELLG